jgi:hypothetical protein
MSFAFLPPTSKPLKRNCREDESEGNSIRMWWTLDRRDCDHDPRDGIDSSTGNDRGARTKPGAGAGGESGADKCCDASHREQQTVDERIETQSAQDEDRQHREGNGIRQKPQVGRPSKRAQDAMTICPAQPFDHLSSNRPLT